MKKIYIVVTAIILNMAYLSCTPQQLSDKSAIPQACCGEEGTIPPPPPPPPTGGTFGG